MRLVCRLRQAGSFRVHGEVVSTQRAGLSLSIHGGRGRRVWHHPIVALDGPAEFLMLMWEQGDARDCLTCRLPETVEAML